MLLLLITACSAKNSRAAGYLSALSQTMANLVDVGVSRSDPPRRVELKLATFEMRFTNRPATILPGLVPRKGYLGTWPADYGKTIWLANSDLPRNKTKHYNHLIGSLAEKEVIQ